jgi:hypothetical protein
MAAMAIKQLLPTREVHDEQCKNGGVTFQLELHLQQTGPLFGPEPYKHPKITKLNLNTPWMKYNKKKTLLIIVSYLR